MHQRTTAAAAAMACALAITACSRDASRDIRDRTAEPASDTAREAGRIADAQREHDNDIAKMNERVSSLRRDYDEKMAARPRGTSGTASSLPHDVGEAVNGVERAVAELRTTTADNWWDRHELALKHAGDAIDADVRTMTGGRVMPPAPVTGRTTDAAGQPVSTAPFTSRRDAFVTAMQARIDGWKTSLDKVKATGARETALDDLKARVDHMKDNVDHLKSASADDWWETAKDRVNDEIDRVEKSVARLDDVKDAAASRR